MKNMLLNINGELAGGYQESMDLRLGEDCLTPLP